jgi:ribosomal protein S18 acetylase RimI-like enzyme
VTTKLDTTAVLTSAGPEPWLTVAPLARSCQGEALSFLSERPLHTFGLSGLMLSNGVISRDNRGTFYVCRGKEGRLEGVALIGHANLFETRTAAATKAFASLTRQCPAAELILGEEQEIRSFWSLYQERGAVDCVSHRDVLLELRRPIEASEPVPDLRPATFDDLDPVVSAHALIGLKERRVNPLKVDATGFRQRCARRIELGRTWVLTARGKLIFKAEVVCATPQVAYLESIGVHVQERGKGYGSRCVSQLARQLLPATDRICVLVQEDNRRALDFYGKVGFNPVANYSSIFPRQQKPHCLEPGRSLQ